MKVAGDQIQNASMELGSCYIQKQMFSEIYKKYLLQNVIFEIWYIGNWLVLHASSDSADYMVIQSQVYRLELWLYCNGLLVSYLLLIPATAAALLDSTDC